MDAFHKTTWSQVKAGDIVLVPWESLSEIAEVEVATCRTLPGLDGKPLVRIGFRFCAAGYELSFDPEAVAYIQSRL